MVQGLVVTSTNLIMNDQVLEDSYIDEKERMKLNSYNINKEKGIGTLQNFRWLDRESPVCYLLERQETGDSFNVKLCYF